MQLYIDAEIGKKAEKERLMMKGEKEGGPDGGVVSGGGKKKKTWEQKMAVETEVDETEEDFLRFYFVRERVIMERIYGGEWRRHLRHYEWQSRRDQYQVPEVRPSAGSSSPTSSMSDDRRSEVAMKMRSRTRGFLNFLKAGDDFRQKRDLSPASSTEAT